MTILDDRPHAATASDVAPRTVPEQLADWVDDARADMTTSPTPTDRIVDTAVWLARYVLLLAVLAVTWPWYLPSRGMRVALIVAVVAMAPAGYVAGIVSR